MDSSSLKIFSKLKLIKECDLFQSPLEVTWWLCPLDPQDWPLTWQEHCDLKLRKGLSHSTYMGSNSSFINSCLYASDSPFWGSLSLFMCQLPKATFPFTKTKSRNPSSWKQQRGGEMGGNQAAHGISLSLCFYEVVSFLPRSHGEGPSEAGCP